MRDLFPIAAMVLMSCGAEAAGDTGGGTSGSGGTDGTGASTAGTTGSATTGGSGTTASATSESAGGTATGPGSSGATATSGGSSGGSGATTGTTEGTGGSTGTTGTSGTTGGVDDEEYYAFALIGALDRIVIRKANNSTQQCTELRLVSPGPMGGLLNITVPVPWGVESASLYNGLTDCLSAATPQAPQDWAVSATGDVTFDDPTPSSYPCSLDLDVTIYLEQAQVWSIASDGMGATNLAVNGC